MRKANGYRDPTGYVIIMLVAFLFIAFGMIGCMSLQKKDRVNHRAIFKEDCTKNGGYHFRHSWYDPGRGASDSAIVCVKDNVVIGAYPKQYSIDDKFAKELPPIKFIM